LSAPQPHGRVSRPKLKLHPTDSDRISKLSPHSKHTRKDGNGNLVARTDASLSTNNVNRFPVPTTLLVPALLHAPTRPHHTLLAALVWSSLIQSYCRHNHIFQLSVIDALSTPLFHNATLSRQLSLRDAKAIFAWMASPEGGNRAEWISSGGKKKPDEGEGGRVWVYWRRPEEWAAQLEEWVERTGQRGTVLTLYEIVEGDASQREEFCQMDMELLQKSLGVCVKRGKAQIFGQEGSEGVKFF
jgi:ESCRT-II complex subunit VPS25